MKRILDPLDERILAELTLNARAAHAELAAKVNLSRNAVASSGVQNVCGSWMGASNAATFACRPWCCLRAVTQASITGLAALCVQLGRLAPMKWSMAAAYSGSF